MSNDIIENDRIKQRCAEKVLLEQDQLGLLNLTVAKYLGVTNGEVSSIKREEMYKYVTKTSWRKIHDWYNSGMSLEEWYHKRIKEVEHDETPEAPEQVPETIPNIKRSAQPQPEPPKEEMPAPKEEQPAAPPVPEFKHETETLTVPATLEIKKHVFHTEQPKGKPGRKKQEDKPGRPSQEEIERVLATLGVEIAIVIKLKNKQD
jgi:hypothetical protein